MKSCLSLAAVLLALTTNALAESESEGPLASAVAFVEAFNAGDREAMAAVTVDDPRIIESTPHSCGPVTARWIAGWMIWPTPESAATSRMHSYNYARRTWNAYPVWLATSVPQAYSVLPATGRRWPSTARSLLHWGVCMGTGKSSPGAGAARVRDLSQRIKAFLTTPINATTDQSSTRNKLQFDRHGIPGQIEASQPTHLPFPRRFSQKLPQAR